MWLITTVIKYVCYIHQRIEIINCMLQFSLDILKNKLSYVTDEASMVVELIHPSSQKRKRNEKDQSVCMNNVRRKE
jgi:hypothetical protein